MFYWLTGNALLIYYVIVNLRLHIPWFDVLESQAPDDGYINVRSMLNT